MSPLSSYKNNDLFIISTLPGNDFVDKDYAKQIKVLSTENYKRSGLKYSFCFVSKTTTVMHRVIFDIVFKFVLFWKTNGYTCISIYMYM